MKQKVLAPVLASVLILAIIFSLATNQDSGEGSNVDDAVVFRGFLNLTNVNHTRNAVGFYMINRNATIDNSFQIFTPDSWDEMNLTVKLGEIKETTDVIILRNQTLLSGPVRLFEARIEHGNGYSEEVNGWIDQTRNVHERYEIEFVLGTGHNSGPWISPSVRFNEDEYCIDEFIEKTSEDGYEYWNITVGPVEISEDDLTEGENIRWFSANTKWRNGTIFCPYAGYITEDLEIHYTRLT